LLSRICTGLLTTWCLALPAAAGVAADAPATAPAPGVLFEQGLTLAEIHDRLADLYADVRAAAFEAARHRYMETAGKLAVLERAKAAAVKKAQEAETARREMDQMNRNNAVSVASRLTDKQKQTKRRTLVLNEYSRFTRVADRIVAEVADACARDLKDALAKHDAATVDAIKRAAALAAFNTARKTYDEQESRRLDGLGVPGGDERWVQKLALVTIRDGLPTLQESLREAERVIAALEAGTDIPLIHADERRQDCEKKLAKLRAATVASAEEGARKVSKLAQEFQDLSKLLTVIEDRQRERQVFGIVVLLSLVVLFAALLGYRNMGLPTVDSASSPEPGADDEAQTAGTEA